MAIKSSLQPIKRALSRILAEWDASRLYAAAGTAYEAAKPRFAKARRAATSDARPHQVSNNTPAQVAVDPRLDAAILDNASIEWCKVAMLIARATDAARAAELSVTSQDIANRIYAMASDNRLEVSGNVRRWRAAEVRKRASA